MIQGTNKIKALKYDPSLLVDLHQQRIVGFKVIVVAFVQSGDVSAHVHLLLGLVGTVRTVELGLFAALPLDVVSQGTAKLIETAAFRTRVDVRRLDVFSSFEHLQLLHHFRKRRQDLFTSLCLVWNNNTIRILSQTNIIN